MNKPLVSICCITYNHERYIRDALEGFLMQKTQFPYDIIIYDDASTDDTSRIIKEYVDSRPDLISPILQTENRYSKGENPFLKYIVPRLTSKYIAICEGDDFWTDPLKLQKQVDYLQSNPDYRMVCTNYSKYYQSIRKTQKDCFAFRKFGTEVKFTDYLMDMSSIGTATVIIHTELVRQYLTETPEEIRDNFIVGDTPLWLFAAAKSRIGVLPDETAVYRILDNSACHFKTPGEHFRFVQKGFEMADYFCEKYGNNSPTLLKGLNQKKLKAALFHGYRSMDKDLASNSYKALMSSKPGFKRRLSSRLMLLGSYNKFLNRVTGIVLKKGMYSLNRA